MSILQQVWVKFQKVAEMSLDASEGGMDYVAFESRLKEELNSLDRAILAEVPETRDAYLKDNRACRAGWQIERKGDEKAILTPFGEVRYRRTYYRHAETREYAYLVDRLAGHSSHARGVRVLMKGAGARPVSVGGDARSWLTQSLSTPNRGSSGTPVNPRLGMDPIKILAAQFLSQLGDWVANVALPLAILANTGSPLLVSVALLLELLAAIVFAPVAGVAVDYGNRRSIMVLSDLIRAAMLLVMSSTSHLWLLLTLAFLAGGVSQFFNPAFQASIPNIITKEKLLRFNSLRTSLTTVALMVGPTAEGMIGRGRARCALCGKSKIVSWAVQTGQTVAPQAASSEPRSVSLVSPWYWEGNVQSVLVTWLVGRGYKVRSVANTATREQGRDIVAVGPDGRELWVSVKGYPEKSALVQARHWLSGALFDLVLYRGEDPDADLALGLPDGFGTYTALAGRVAWLMRDMPFAIYWVAESGTVRVEPKVPG